MCWCARRGRRAGTAFQRAARAPARPASLSHTQKSEQPDSKHLCYLASAIKEAGWFQLSGGLRGPRGERLWSRGLLSPLWCLFPISGPGRPHNTGGWKGVQRGQVEGCGPPLSGPSPPTPCPLPSLALASSCRKPSLPTLDDPGQSHTQLDARAPLCCPRGRSAYVESGPRLWGGTGCPKSSQCHSLHQLSGMLTPKSGSSEVATFSRGFGCQLIPHRAQCSVSLGPSPGDGSFLGDPGPRPACTRAFPPHGSRPPSPAHSGPRQRPALRAHTHLGLGFSSGHHSTSQHGERGERDHVRGAHSCPWAPGVHLAGGFLGSSLQGCLLSH